MKERLGIEIENRDIVVPFYGVTYRIRPKGIADDQGCRPSHSVNVILCKYLLLCPENEPTEDDWVTYKDFKNASPFVEGFRNNAERPIGPCFSGRLEDLRKACAELTGRPFEAEISADLVMKLNGSKTHPQLRGRKFIMILVKSMADLIRDKQEHTAEISFALRRTHQNAMVSDILGAGEGKVSFW